MVCDTLCHCFSSQYTNKNDVLIYVTLSGSDTIVQCQTSTKLDGKQIVFLKMNYFSFFCIIFLGLVHQRLQFIFLLFLQLAAHLFTLCIELCTPRNRLCLVCRQSGLVWLHSKNLLRIKMQIWVPVCLLVFVILVK